MVCFQSSQKLSAKNLVCVIISVSICASLHLYLLTDIATFLSNMTNIASKARQHRGTIPKLPNMKYILFWRDGITQVNGLGKCKCPVSNCIFTEHRGLLNGDHTLFDAIVFDVFNLNRQAQENPTRRASSQLYIFNSEESSSNFPACELYLDDFFNWTFTYRLDSDVVWNSFVVRNMNGSVVAPSETVQWNITKYPITDEVKSILKGKTRAAAWIVSNCAAVSLRHEYLTKLQEYLFQYSLQIDVYGRCTKRKCDKNDCKEMIKKKYYFYMAFENSFADDYVTEKVLHGYHNYAVPIVYGGANYSRFLPPGSYLNAREIHPYNLAHAISVAINDAKEYEAYFQWRHSYTVDSNATVFHPLCELCKALNSNKSKSAPTKKNFRLWWNTLNGMKWCLSDAFWNETSKIHVDGSHVYKNTY